MDIENFTLTLALGLLSGLLIGIFGREILRVLGAMFMRVYGTPRYLRPYRKPEQRDNGDQGAD